MKIAMIVAMSTNRVIGINNQLPWKLSADMAWFKKQTMNKVILLGRKTWESLPIRPLPGRKHIIISQNKNYQPLAVSGEALHDVGIVSSIDEALELAQQLINNIQQKQAVATTDLSENLNEKEIELMVIGGASIYKLMLPICDRLYQTIVKTNINGDAWFPEIVASQWQEIYKESHKSNDVNEFDYNFTIKERIKKSD